MKKAIFVILFVSFVGIIGIVIFFTQKDESPSPEVLSSRDVTVSASIGSAVSYTLFGYTSAYATVQLEGIGIATSTTADRSGYFRFVNFLAPSSIKEFCFTAIDTEGGVSPPLCVPAPETSSSHVDMGPYLLPPSITLSTGSTTSGKPVTVTGKTIPNTNVALTLYSPSSDSLSLIKSAYAASNNQKTVSTRAGADGSYTHTYTGGETGKVRVFSRSNYLNNYTPKSNTLSFSLLGWLAVVLYAMLNFLRTFLNPNTIIILEILALAALVFVIFRRKSHKAHVRQNLAIIPYEDPLPMVVDYTKLKTE